MQVAYAEQASQVPRQRRALAASAQRRAASPIPEMGIPGRCGPHRGHAVNGERTGNVDIITVGMNMFALSVDRSSTSRTCRARRDVQARHAHARLAAPAVRPATSSSLPSPARIRMPLRRACTGKRRRIRTNGRCRTSSTRRMSYEYDGDVVRINNQSGKGGVGFIMEQKYGIDACRRCCQDFGYCVKAFPTTGTRNSCRMRSPDLPG